MIRYSMALILLLSLDVFGGPGDLSPVVLSTAAAAMVSERGEVSFEIHPLSYQSTNNAGVLYLGSLQPNSRIISGYRYSKRDDNTLCYPNPVKDELHFINHSHFTHFSLLSLTGELILEPTQLPEKGLSCKHLPAGMFILQAIDRNGISHQEIITKL